MVNLFKFITFNWYWQATKVTPLNPISSLFKNPHRNKNIIYDIVILYDSTYDLRDFSKKALQ